MTLIVYLLSVLDPTGSFLSVSAGKLVSDLRNPDRPNLQETKQKYKLNLLEDFGCLRCYLRCRVVSCRVWRPLTLILQNL